MKNLKIFSLLILCLIGQSNYGFAKFKTNFLNKAINIQEDEKLSDTQSISFDHLYVYMQSLVNKGDRYPYEGRPINDPVVRFYLYSDIEGTNRTVAPIGFSLYVEYTYKKGNGTAKSTRPISMSGRNYIEIPLIDFTATTSEISNWNIILKPNSNYTQINWGTTAR